jgi:serine/threonine protein phosphatase PrpC
VPKEPEEKPRAKQPFSKSTTLAMDESEQKKAGQVPAVRKSMGGAEAKANARGDVSPFEDDHTGSTNIEKVPEKPVRVIAKYGYKTKAGSMPNNVPKTNQDSFIIQANVFGSQFRDYFAVCDGHGLHGHLVSGYIKSHYPKIMETQYKLQKKDDHAVIRNVLQHSVHQVAKDVVGSSIDCTFSGSTFVGCLVVGTHIYCANVGDSRAVMARNTGKSWQAIALSNDHKPDAPSEMQRILSSGGRVEAYKDYNGEPIGPARVWLKNDAIPGLAMARSVGDTIATQAGVIHDPGSYACLITLTLCRNPRV